MGSLPAGVDVTPTGTRVYVANLGSGNVSVIDTATNMVVTTVNVGGDPQAFGRFIGPLNPNAIPTLSEWGLILAAASLLGLGAWRLTRTDTARVRRP